MTLARSWEDAAKKGFPPEVADALINTRSDWANLRLLLAIPEFQVPLPAGSRSSQTDLVALARAESGLMVIAVEGKVDESLGPTVAQKRAEKSKGVDERMHYLENSLGLLGSCPDGIRYQLLHRTVSALRIAAAFDAKSAVMLIHSFSPSSKWHADFEAFAGLFGVSPTIGAATAIGIHGDIELYIGWCTGDQRFRVDVGAPVE